MRKKNKFIYFIPLFLALALVVFISNNDSEFTSSDGSYKEFNLTEHSLTLKLPTTTKTKDDNLFTNSEIKFSSFLVDESLNYRGYVQLWQITDLDKYIDTAKTSSETTFSSYKQKKIQVNDLNGYEIKWSAFLKNKQTVSGREFFLKKEKNDQVLRISLFTNSDPFPKNLEVTAKTILSSVDWE